MQSEGAVTKIFNRIANAINRFSNGVEAAKGRTLEGIALVFYCVGHMLMFLVHEPWFDEALAWLIARDSSIYEILFVTPHYEGHPALWHMILVPFAKLGAPYELSLSIVGLLFSGLAMGLFIYKAPFKRIFRITIPFTYYLFYQYGAISRPYCMMMLAFVLMAISFKQRNEKTGRFVLSLLLLCISGAYGIVIAGGICIAWLIEMLISANKKSMEKNSDNGESRGAFKIFIEDYLLYKGKIVWLVSLLGYVLFILWRIVPADNTFASLVVNNTSSENGLFVRLLYTGFASLSDLFFTNVFYTSGTLRNAEFYSAELLVAVVIGAGIIACLVYFCMKRKNGIARLLYFFIPYIMLSVFGAVVYLFYHHIGISLLFIGFWIWTEFDSCRDKQTEKSLPDHMEYSADNKNKILFDFGKIALTIMILIPIYWNISSCISDMVSSYGSGRVQYTFLRENGLDNGYTILTDWYKVFDTEAVPDGYTEYDLIFSQQGVNLAPYFKNSEIINSPYLIGKSYTYLHEIPEKQEMKNIYQDILEKGSPDIIIGHPDFIETEKLLEIHGSTHVDYNDYILVFKMSFGNVKKGVSMDTNTYIYVRKNIAEEKGLKAYDQTD